MFFAGAWRSYATKPVALAIVFARSSLGVLCACLISSSVSCVTFMDVSGIRNKKPGFRRVSIATVLNGRSAHLLIGITDAAGAHRITIGGLDQQHCLLSGAQLCEALDDVLVRHRQPCRPDILVLAHPGKPERI